MTELLTTDEAAAYLRLSERKLYGLVARAAVPCTKVTGRWLFPRAALDRWVMAGLITPAALARPAAPSILGGSHDPLLEWALRESRCGLAYLPEGSGEGLRRLTQGEVIAAAIHLHALDAADDEQENLAAVATAAGLHDAVVIAFARREQGIVMPAGNPLGLADIVSLAGGVRVAQRPAGAGAQLLLLALLRRAGVTPDRISFAHPICPTGTEIAQAIRSGRADCGIATRSVAAIAGLEFLPLIWEHFDLVLRQRDYFLPGPQALFSLLRSPVLRERALELGGYDVGTVGEVRLLN